MFLFYDLYTLLQNMSFVLSVAYKREAHLLVHYCMVEGKVGNALSESCWNLKKINCQQLTRLLADGALQFTCYDLDYPFCTYQTFLSTNTMGSQAVSLQPLVTLSRTNTSTPGPLVVTMNTPQPLLLFAMSDSLPIRMASPAPQPASTGAYEILAANTLISQSYGTARYL